MTNSPDPAIRPAPELPPFIAKRFPVPRRLLDLRRSPNAGLVLHYADTGADGPGVVGAEARPVLLVHGNPTWSFLWRRVIEALEPGDGGPAFRSVAPDLLGLGLSSKLPAVGDHSLDRHAAAIVELVETLDLRDLVVVGQDWGGPVGTVAAARMRERIAGVVLANTAVILPRHLRGKAFHRFARLPVVSDLAFRVFGFPLRALHRTQGDPASIRGDVARAYRWPLRRMRDRVAPLALARMVPDSDDHPTVAVIREAEEWILEFAEDHPVALVWGTRDPILGRAIHRHETAMPRATVRKTQAGHFLQEEVPNDLADAIREVASVG